MPTPKPYVPKNPDDLIRAADWNNIQIEARTALQSHDHTGTGDDPTQPLSRAAIKPNAIDGTRIDPASVVTVKDLTTTGSLAAKDLSVAGAFKLANRTLLAEFDALNTRFVPHDHSGGDKGVKIPRAGIAPGAVDGSLIDPAATVTLKDLSVSGSLKVANRTLLAEFDNLNTRFVPHDHSGGDKGVKIPRAGIAPGAVDGSLIDPAATVTLKDLMTTGLLAAKELSVSSAFKVANRALLTEFDALNTRFGAHDHSGGDKGVKIPRAGIAPAAIDGSLIDPAAAVTLKDLTTTGLLTAKDLTTTGSLTAKDLTVSGVFKIANRTPLTEFDALQSRFTQHDHSSADKGPKIPRAGIAPGAVDGSLIDPAAKVTLAELSVNGPFKIYNRTPLAELDALNARFGGHNHTGGANGYQISRAGIMPFAIDGSLVDSSSSFMMTDLAISGLFTIKDREILAELNDLLSKLEGLKRNSPPIGTILAFAGPNPPNGYLLCNGHLASRVTFKNLFDVIGVTWGAGDGTTTFALPDLRGRVPVGAGTGPGLTPRQLALQYGSERVILATAEMPLHNHSGSTAYEEPAHNHIGTTQDGGTHSHPGSTADSAGGHTHPVNPNTDASVSIPASMSIPQGIPTPPQNLTPQNSSYTMFPAYYKYKVSDHGHTLLMDGAHGHPLTIRSEPHHKHPFVTEAGKHAHNFTTSGTGEGKPHENMQPSTAVQYIIKF